MAKDDPEAVRIYRVFIGDEVFGIPAAPDHPVAAYIEQIYRNAL